MICKNPKSPDLCRFDFNSDGLISREDVKMVLYYVPMMNKHKSSSSIERQQSQMNIS